MTRDIPLNIAVTVLTACAIITTALVVRRELIPRGPSVSAPQIVSGWRIFATSGHRMGPVNAPVTIVVFADFQCPFCARLVQGLRTIRQRYPADVAIVFRHFPLSIHPQAILAVRASECAAVQGRFESFHDALFAEQDSVESKSWRHFARIARIDDMHAFEKCVAATTAIPQLSRDTIVGNKLKVSGTPTFLINETRLQGAQPVDTIEAYVQRALRTRRLSRT